jgi:hypothetical protein
MSVIAVAAVVVEELDEGDVAALVAEGDVTGRVEDDFRILRDAGFVLFGFRGGLALVQFCHRLFEHFRMRDQVVLHDSLDLAALTVGEGLCRGGGRAERERKQSGREQAKRGHVQFLFGFLQFFTGSHRDPIGGPGDRFDFVTLS